MPKSSHLNLSVIATLFTNVNILAPPPASTSAQARHVPKQNLNQENIAQNTKTIDL